jgi:hypothetical protein
MREIYVLAAVKRSPSTSIRRSYRACVTRTSLRISFQSGVFFVRITFTEYTTLCRDITPNVYDIFKAAAIGTVSLLYTVHGWGLICCGWFYLQNKFALLGTENHHNVTQCHLKQRFAINMWLGVSSNNLIGRHVIEWLLMDSFLLKLSGKWITYVFRGRASCNKRTNVAPEWRGTSTFRQRGNGIFERNL